MAWPAVIASFGFVLILLVVYGSVCSFSVDDLWSLACEWHVWFDRVLDHRFGPLLLGLLILPLLSLLL